MTTKGLRFQALSDYRAALQTLREYFSRDLDTMDLGPDGAFDAKGWKSMTYLLQAAVKYEQDILKLKIKEVEK